MIVLSLSITVCGWFCFCRVRGRGVRPVGQNRDRLMLWVCLWVCVWACAPWASWVSSRGPAGPEASAPGLREMLREGRGLALGFPVQPDPASFLFSLKMVGLSWLGGSQPSAWKGRRSSSSGLTLCNPRPVTRSAQIPGWWPSASFVPGSQTAQAQPAG